MQTEKKIVICANDSWYAYKFRLDLMRSLVRDGFKVYVVTGDKSYRAQLRSEGVELLVARFQPRSRSIPSLLVGVYSVAMIIRKLKPDAILTFNPAASLVVSLASLFFRSAQVSTISGFGQLKPMLNKELNVSLKRLYRNTLLYFLVNRPKLVLSQNAADLDFVLRTRGSAKPTLRVMGSGVDLNAFRTVDRDYSKRSVLFAARFLRDKGILEFIEAGKRLATKDFRFSICGLPVEGPDGLSEDEVKAHLANTEIAYLGQIEDMAPKLQETDILVLPSKYGEGIPRILIEGAASGCILVGYDIDGVREIILNEETGILIANDGAQNLIDSLSELEAMDAQTLSEMSKTARQRAEDAFSVETVTQKYREAINLILSEARQLQ